jgi:hypothetical protein
MSMTESDAQYEEWMDELYREHKEQAIEEFTDERLHSFYLAHPLVAKPPSEALAEARKLAKAHTSAAQVFAAVSVEVGLKVALLKPVVHGLVHSESAAEIITDLTLRHTRFDFFHKLLSQILSEHGGVDLETYTRAGAGKTLWNEIIEVQKCRDHLLHRAETASSAQAMQAIAVAEAIVEELFPTVISHLGLHLHDGMRVCGDHRCRYRHILRKAEQARLPTTKNLG